MKTAKAFENYHTPDKGENIKHMGRSPLTHDTLFGSRRGAYSPHTPFTPAKVSLL